LSREIHIEDVNTAAVSIRDLSHVIRME